jgi:parallel beta-helix repeat protein
LKAKRSRTTLFTIIIAVTLGISSNCAVATEFTVHSGESIQDTVSNSRPGDMIIVEPGVYKEQISTYTDDLTIMSQSGNPADTILEGSGFAIWASNITVKGFTLKGNNSDSGIAVLDREGKCHIENNEISNYASGIEIPVGSTFNIMSSNKISNCQEGITVSEGFENSVSINEVSNCQSGITFREGNRNTIQNNKVSNCQSGITYMEGFENSVNNNEISNCGDGLNMGNGDAAPAEIGTRVENNIITKNNVGISVGGIEGGYVIAGNTISSNKNGYEDYTTGGNLIYNNYFNNTVNVNLQGNQKAQNTWNTNRTAGKNIIGGSGIGGNYWATPGGNGFSQTHFDLDGDGISEAPYSLNGVNIDNLPLAFPAQQIIPVLPEANFSANITRGYAPLWVQFNDYSKYSTGRRWDFENDGNTDSTDVNPFHIYAAPGNYTVNLTAVNENGTKSTFANIIVLEQPVLPEANFSANITQGPAPLPVQFTDLSEDAVSWSWDFDNNGHSESSDKNPVYTYTIPGTYTVNMTVSNANGTASKLAAIIVTDGGQNNSGDNGSTDNGEPDGSSSGGHSHRSSGGGIAANRSSEPTTSVEIKELPKTSVSNGTNETEIGIDFENRTNNESDTSNKGLKTQQKQSPGIPGFEIGYGVVCLLGSFLYRKK